METRKRSEPVPSKMFCFVGNIACGKVPQRISMAPRLSSRKPHLQTFRSLPLIRHQISLCFPTYGSRLSQSPRHTSPTKMSNDSTKVSLPTRIGAVLVVAGLIITAFLPAAGVFKNAFTESGDTLVDYQLSKVPVFTVTDATGRPFLSESEDHRSRLGYFFIQPSDAQLYLDRVKTDNSDAKVLTVGLNEAVKYLDSKSLPAKSVPESFSLFPDEHESQIAQELTDGAFQRAFGSFGVPIFYVDGLGIKDGKEGETVIPLFFEKEKLDETVETLKRQSPAVTIDLKDLQVIDLKQTIKEIQAGGNPKFNRIAFVPLTESLKTMKEKQVKQTAP